MRHSVTSILKKASMASCVAMLTSLCYAQGGTLDLWGRRILPPGELTGFSQIHSNVTETIGIKRDGSIQTWGLYEMGSPKHPVDTSDLITVRQEQGIYFGLKKDGTLVMWGNANVSHLPTEMLTAKYKSVATGFSYAALIRQDGHVDCLQGDWHLLDYQPPEPNSDFTDVQVGSNSFIGLKHDGTIVCWGDNAAGQCNVPEPNKDFVAVTMGSDFAAGIKKDGSVVCWGNNQYGQCDVPQPNSGFVALSGGYSHIAAIKHDGSVVCWGNDQYGQCDVATPNSDWCQVSANSNCTYGLKRDGTLMMWGKDEYQLPCANKNFVSVSLGMFPVMLNSDGQVVMFPTYGYSALPPFPNNSDIVAVSSGYSCIAGLKKDGSITGIRLNPIGTFSFPKPSVSYTAIACGAQRILALKEDGTIDQLYMQGAYPSDLPFANSNIAAISTCGEHNALLRKDGSIVVWGGAPAENAVPEPNTDFIAVRTGDFHTLGIKRDGSIVVWPKGSPLDNIPSPNTDFVDAVIGFEGCIAKKRDGSIVAWGWSTNDFLKLPHGSQGIIAFSADKNTYAVIRETHDIAGQIQLSDYNGDIKSPQVSLRIASATNPDVSECLSVIPFADGHFTTSSFIKPPYNVQVFGSHFLSTKLTGVDPSQSLNAALVNGDADGDGHINLFDYVKLDASFNSSDPMADLDGDGQVNLFDYVIIDRSFGAQAQ